MVYFQFIERESFFSNHIIWFKKLCIKKKTPKKNKIKGIFINLKKFKSFHKKNKYNHNGRKKI